MKRKIFSALCAFLLYGIRPCTGAMGGDRPGQPGTGHREQRQRDGGNLRDGAERAFHLQGGLENLRAEPEILRHAQERELAGQREPEGQGVRADALGNLGELRDELREDAHRRELYAAGTGGHRLRLQQHHEEKQRVRGRAEEHHHPHRHVHDRQGTAGPH